MSLRFSQHSLKCTLNDPFARKDMEQGNPIIQAQLTLLAGHVSLQTTSNWWSKYANKLWPILHIQTHFSCLSQESTREPTLHLAHMWIRQAKSSMSKSRAPIMMNQAVDSHTYKSSCPSNCLNCCHSWIQAVHFIFPGARRWNMVR